MDKHNKMLIDATHPEETRVVVLRNGRVEEFDYESASRKLLRGNIYLAKVTRVEPSLQAAFVDYGGNRHGFLAFNEIHPDYYQIPVADREALKQEEAEEEARAEAEADERARRREQRARRHRTERPADDEGHAPETVGEYAGESSDIGGEADREPAFETRDHHDHHDDGEPRSPSAAMPLAVDEHDARRREDIPSEAREGEPSEPRDELRDLPEIHGNVEEVGVVEIDGPGDAGNGHGNGEVDQVEQIATEEDALEEVPERPRRRMRQYKIQEVIKRRQIILVQVVKEERGNKGAALTTYISLAGRYTVLMPNTGRGGGISRKITQPQDRKRLKAIAEELDVPEGMGLIIRTAGAARTKQEIKRDYEYLLRLWESVREMTLSSTAPCLVYEEGNLIKRSIRDLYSKDIDEVIVAGDEAHHEAQDFMGMLMPGHAENVTRYHSAEPLFTRFGIERQLNAMFSPYVTLRSGGYLVINQTEALVAIDVNSGKSTREFSIEETALNTNMEASEEIARQLKLRDLAGLIVVDFIDMEEKRNNRSVERRLKDALKNDRARIQVGRISHFGLLEMSRQRLRTGVLEGSTSQCPHCQGTGIIRSTESVALAVLRGLEDQLMKQPSSLVATTTASVALYILNHKRTFINDMETRHGITINVEASDRMQGANFSIDRVTAPVSEAKPANRSVVSMDWAFEEGAEGEPEEPRADLQEARRHDHDHEHEPRGGEGEGGEQRQGRRRRRRRGRRDREGGEGGRQFGHGGAQHESGEHLDDAGETSDDGHRHEPREATSSESGGAAQRSSDRSVARDDVPGEGEATDEGGSEARHPHSEGEGREEGGERRRRGRRRGRRGGRGRGQEGGFGPRPGDEEAAGLDEIARPGADQPFLTEHTGEPPPFARTPESERHLAIVETVTYDEQRPSEGREMKVVEYPAPREHHEPATEIPIAAEAAVEHRPPIVTPTVVIEAEPKPAPVAVVAETVAEIAPEPKREDPDRPARKGWWQRKFGS